MFTQGELKMIWEAMRKANAQDEQTAMFLMRLLVKISNLIGGASAEEGEKKEEAKPQEDIKK